MNIPKTYIFSSETRCLPFFLKEWKRTKERDESENNEFVYNFFFHKQKKKTRVRREMKQK